MAPHAALTTIRATTNPASATVIAIAAWVVPSHFSAMLIFALFVSVAFTCTGRRTATGRIKHALSSFGIFVAIGVGIAWLMHPFSN
jgi:hypothetical protein